MIYSLLICIFTDYYKNFRQHKIITYHEKNFHIRICNIRQMVNTTKAVMQGPLDICLASVHTHA